MAIALCNLTRMERGEAWSQNENIPDAVGRLIEALDAERLAIAAAFGATVRTVRGLAAPEPVRREGPTRYLSVPRMPSE